jgi:polyhydroxyalkanoate synthesis regulator phasin
MKKVWVLLTMAATVVAMTIVSFSIVWAQGEEDGDSRATEFTVRVAEILGLSAEEVDAAVKQARTEMKQNALQAKMDGLVKEGKLTQEKADEYLEWIQSKPEGLPGINGRGFNGKKHGFPGEMHPKRPRHKSPYFDKKGGFGIRQHHIIRHAQPLPKDSGALGKEIDWDSILKRLEAAVEAGEITQEQADERLEGLK